MRVTGRFESEQQKLAPWGYGDDFDVAQVPPGLRHVLEKIQVRWDAYVDWVGLGWVCGIYR